MSDVSPGDEAEVQTFRRNREELVWMIFVLVVGTAFAVSSSTLFAARLTAESHVGRFDAPYDVVWALCCVAMLFTLGYYVQTTAVFVRRAVRVDSTGVFVGEERVDWDALLEVREQTIRRRFHCFKRLELVRGPNDWVPVTSALIADYAGFVERVRAARPGILWTVQGTDR